MNVTDGSFRVLRVAPEPPFADARSKIDDWRMYYNGVRPPSALQWMTPTGFARQASESASPDNSTKPEISTVDLD
ncbi:integrase core domain-containing protein [Burkholderia pseudomultivorans]|uniref:integrase core domain-containing protein n=1 Tax=Burkholderia pseudomultivorans TaxID=1207504 RepID=UPI0012DA8ED1